MRGARRCVDAAQPVAREHAATTGRVVFQARSGPPSTTLVNGSLGVVASGEGGGEEPSGEAIGRSPNLEYAVDLMRAFGGAVLFAFPLVMTMEMWSLGFAVDRGRLLLFLVLNLPILLALSYLAGFRASFSLKEDALDALAALAVGAFASTMLLLLFGLLSGGMSLDELVGKVAIQTVPASLGAMAARKQLGDGDQEGAEDQGGYAGQLVLMLAGALFLAFNVAPTEEMILISFHMTPWHGLAIMVLSIGALHAFVYALEFSGQEDLPRDVEAWRTFLSYSLAGYGIAVLVSLYVLWTFGRTDGAALGRVAMMVAVLGFPASLGAAVARLVV